MTTSTNHEPQQQEAEDMAPEVEDTSDERVFSQKGNNYFKFLQAGFWALVVALIWMIGSLGFIPNVMGYTPLTVYTPSMEPTMKTGSMVWIDSAPQNYTVGDIVSYYPEPNDATLYTHRITGVRSDGGYVTKGDNNAEADEPIVADQIAGKVVEPKFAIIRGTYSIPDYINQNKPLLVGGLIGLGIIGLFGGKIERALTWRKPS